MDNAFLEKPSVNSVSDFGFSGALLNKYKLSYMTGQKSPDVIDLLKKRASVENSLGNIKFRLGLDGAQASTRIGLLDILAKARYDGEYSVDGKAPLLKGSLGFRYEHTPDDNLYWLQFKKQF